MKLAQLRLLVVEDDSFQRKAAISMLHALGVESILSAENGKMALEIIHGRDQVVDVAICDLNMPEMDGLEFLRHLSHENRNISIIITSALDNKLLASVARMTKMFGVRLLGTMEKPMSLAGLQNLLMKYDQREREVYSAVVDRNFSLDEILQGLAANQFQPYFQPKVALKDGRLVGAEALARWLHPEHGVIAPAAFIPLLEQSGKIDQLTFRMLEESAAACRLFHERGHILTISVNLSLASLDEPMLADRITSIVREAGIEPQYIVLEITESAAMTNVAHALENLARLCMNGFALSIDDYGTGYSSLQQLTRIAFSELKIDQSFVKDAADNKALRIVVESSIEMARKLQVSSVAEGAETQRDWDMLRNAGCDTVQGYFIAKPMDAEAFSDFMLKHGSNVAFMQTTSPRQESGINILVVDDNDFTRKIFLRVLNDLGFANVCSADSAQAALQLFGKKSFELVITDVHMPGMNGMELIQQIRAGRTHLSSDTRAVVLTSFSQAEVLATALALDVNGFLVKPVVPATVDKKLAQAMTEDFRPRPPLAYEAIRTGLTSLPGGNGQQEGRQGAVAASVIRRSLRGGSVLRRTIHSLRAGMKLRENIYLPDGTLLLSSGHVFSELSINRLSDLKELLPDNGFAVEEP